MQIKRQKEVFSKLKFVDAVNLFAISLFFARELTGEIAYLFTGMLIGLGLLTYQTYLRHSVPLIAVVSLVVVCCSYGLTLANNGLSHGALFIPLYLACFGIAWRIYTNGINYWFCWILFYCSVFYFLVSFHTIDGGASTFLANSRNHVSVFFLNAAVLVYVGAFKSGRKISLIPAALVLLISVLSVGFGGILSAFIFFFLTVFYIVNNYSFTSKCTIFVLLSLFVLISTQFWNDIFTTLMPIVRDFDDVGQKIDGLQHFEEHSRYLIWSAYFKELNLLRLLIGSDIGEEFHGVLNLHNSYLLLHQRMGLLSLIFVFYFIYSSARFYKRNSIFFACLGALLIRGVVDTTFFAGSSFDFVLVYLVFFASSQKRTHQRHNQLLLEENRQVLGT